MSLAAATSGGTDSGVETGNDSNDLDVNIVVPPPPPTSPESSTENHNENDDSESEMTISMRDHFPIFPINNESTTTTTVGSDTESVDMDRYVEEDEDDELRTVEHLPPPPFVSTSGVINNDDTVEEDVFPSRDQKGSVIYFQAYNPPYHEFTLPSFTPPPPPPTPTNLNTCKALMKFEFPELPKLMCQFVEPPVGLQSFISLEPFDGKQSKGYNIVSSAPEEYGQRSTQCTALIPYEYEQHELRNKSYSVWKSKRLRRSSSGCIGMTGRAEYNERRLRTAANANNVPMLTKILESGTDPNAADELGRSALHSAACRGHSEVVRLLLHYGANPNKKDAVGNTPLHLAACTNHFDVVTCLLRAGTDVSTLDNRGRNPLQLAQSKLKLIANSAKQHPVTEDTIKIKTEVQQIIEMMLEYLQKRGQDIELLNAFANRLTLSQTPDEVDADVKSLLANLSSLTLTSASNSASTANKKPLTTPVSIPFQLGHSSSSFLQPSKLFSSNNSMNMTTSCENTVKIDTNHSVGGSNEMNNFSANHVSNSPPFSFFK